MKIIKRDNNDICAFILTAALAIVSFSLADRMFFSDYMLAESDMLCLNIPYNKLILQKLFSKGNLFYSFLPAMGMDISSYIAYLSCLCPINFIYLIISDINLAAIIVTIIKISLASFFFQRFSKKVLNYSGGVSVIFSTFYGLCGYTTVYFFNTHFLDGLYMLPVIIYLISDLVNYKKKDNNSHSWINLISIRLCFSYAYLFICSFYSGYIVGIFSLLYFILILIFTERGKEKARLVIAYLFSVINAVMLSAFILLPAAVYILTNGVSDATKLTGLTANIINIVGNLFLGMFQDRTGDFPYIYSGLAVILLAILFFVNKEISKKTKAVIGILLGFLFLCMTVPVFYLFMHCFDAPDMFYYRFSYMFSFVLISMGIISFKNLKACGEIKISIVSCIVIAVFAIVYFHQTKLISEFQSIKGLTLKLNILLIILYTVLLILKRQEKLNLLVFICFCVIEVVMNNYIVNSKAYVDDLSKKDNFYKIQNQIDDAVNEIKSEDNGIYRTELTSAPFVNYNLLSDTLGTGMFGTFENENYRNTMTALGIATSPRITGIYGTGDLLRMLFGEKFIVESCGVNYNQNMTEARVTINNRALPLGYMVSKDILDFEIEDKNVFNNQNKLLSLFLGHKMEYYHEIIPKLEEELVNIEKTDSGLKLKAGAESGYAKYSFEAGSTNDIPYLYVPQDKSIAVYNSPKLISINGDTGSESMESYVSSPHILRLGEDEDNKYTYAYIFNSKMCETMVNVNEIYLATVDDKVLDEAYDRLSLNSLNITKFIDGYISGTINVSPDSNVLFMPVQYDKNWKVYVDGVKKEIIPLVNNTFIGCYLEPGQHSITFKYDNPLQGIGLCISILDLLMLLFIYYKKRKQI